MVSEKIVKTYTTIDGKEFNSFAEAYQHEQKVVNRIPKRKAEYIAKSKLSSSALSVYGVYEVRGEDPNCDMGGYHHEPYLGTVEGTLDEAIEWAVAQDGWEAWGGGGSVKLVNITKL